ncbi:hypothetical protein [Fundidesulfovibrio putealis]|uniref:hypothetical protein n=1 Tax=Fundidesulfovibrio putealis TaxID=270496 RepID=UPI000416160C|nr:hypothetical protein [Fundidesulfovibrio putealis]
MKSRYTRYLAVVALLLSFCLAILGGFNILIDPYNIFRTPVIKGINDYKNERAHITEPYRLFAKSYDTLIVGSSRVQAIFCEDVTAIAPELNADCINVSTPHAYFPWLVNLVRHANRIRPVKRIVFGLDFFGFNMTGGVFNPADEERLLNVPGKSDLTLINDVLRQMFASGTTELSINSLKGSIQTASIAHGAPTATTTPQEAQGKIFLSFYPGVLSYYQNYSFSGSQGKPSSLEYFHSFLMYCMQENIQVYFFISPVHSIMLDIFKKHNLWTHYFQWERALATMIATANASLPSPLFVLWDFSGYNSITTTQVYNDNNKYTPNEYYADPFHYKRIVGSIMLETVLTGTSSVQDFGVLLTSENIENRLSDLHRERELHSSKNSAYFNMLFSQPQRLRNTAQ